MLGGGPIGCELTQCFARLGSRVTQVEMLPRLLSQGGHRKYPNSFKAGFGRRRRRRPRRASGRRHSNCRPGGQVARLRNTTESTVEIEFDHLLVALGRKPATPPATAWRNSGSESRAAGTIEVDEYMRTRFPNVYACGDAAGPYQFTHVGAHQAWFASVNALFGAHQASFKVDYSGSFPGRRSRNPRSPASGINELRSARPRQGVPHEVTVYDLGKLDRAVADQAAEGLVKVITHRTGQGQGYSARP